MTEEAQKRICRFSSLNHTFVDLESRIEKLSDDVRTLRDAQEEVMIAMNPDDVMLKVGKTAFYPAVSESCLCAGNQGDRRLEASPCTRAPLLKH